MFTDNFNQMFNMFNLGSTWLQYIKLDGTRASSNGYWNTDFRNCFYNFGTPKNLNEVNNGTGSCFIFGTGTTEAKVEDYNLENMIDDSLFVRMTSAYVNSANFGSKMLVSQTIKYVGEDKINITEMGIVARPNSSVYPMFIAREVLKKPYEMKNGDIVTVSMIIN